jgi:hypothetical protein
MTMTQIPQRFRPAATLAKHFAVKARSVLICGAWLLAIAAPSAASDVYVAQVPAGNASGTSCSAARNVEWLNIASHRGANTSEIGPGLKLHLCGTISTPIVIHGSGSEDSPITILFEPHAVMSAPNWGENGRAISSEGNGNLVIDGGTDGRIEATANGSGMKTAYNETGIFLANCSNCAVQNLTVAKMYQHSDDVTDEQGGNSAGIFVLNGSHVRIHHNTVNDARWCISYDVSTPGNTELRIDHNHAFNCDHGIRVGDGNRDATLKSAYIYSNDIHDGVLWDDKALNNHHDGIHVWSMAGTSRIDDLRVWGNYIYGDWGWGLNSLLNLEASGRTTEDDALVFDNLILDQSQRPHAGCGYICVTGDSAAIYNNTIVGQQPQGHTGIDVRGPSSSVENNLVINVSVPTYLAGASLKSIEVWDHNTYYRDKWNNFPFEAWQGFCDAERCHLDQHSSNGRDPNLTSTFQPTAASSSVLQRGVNLSGLGIKELNRDLAGKQRPSEPQPWMIGAFEFQP